MYLKLRKHCSFPNVLGVGTWHVIPAQEIIFESTFELIKQLRVAPSVTNLLDKIHGPRNNESMNNELESKLTSERETEKERERERILSPT